MTGLARSIVQSAVAAAAESDFCTWRAGAELESDGFIRLRLLARPHPPGFMAGPRKVRLRLPVELEHDERERERFPQLRNKITTSIRLLDKNKS